MERATIIEARNMSRVVNNLRNESSLPLPIVMISGAFSPLAIGHVRCIDDASKLKGDGILIAVVNSDEFMTRKKSFVFMPLVERMEILSCIRGVDYIVPWEDGSQTVTGAIEIIRPNIFAKGGHLSNSRNIPEYARCVELGCAIVFGMGGPEKVASSSDLIKKVRESSHE
jgi:D-beta-D-heptose 7-phosphate kinase/D-beta-D-heptose 1-phosphate adenosyltransferase